MGVAQLVCACSGFKSRSDDTAAKWVRMLCFEHIREVVRTDPAFWQQTHGISRVVCNLNDLSVNVTVLIFNLLIGWDGGHLSLITRALKVIKRVWLLDPHWLKVAYPEEAKLQGNLPNYNLSAISVDSNDLLNWTLTEWGRVDCHLSRHWTGFPQSFCSLCDEHVIAMCTRAIKYTHFSWGPRDSQ